MSIYLLAWNPHNWDWVDLDEQSNRIQSGMPVIRRWSCGSKKPQLGDRVFIIRLGVEPKGIFASGNVVKEPYEDIHYNPKKAKEGKTTSYIEVQFDVLVNANEEVVISLEELKEKFKNQNWSTQLSGIEIREEILSELENTWIERTNLTGGSFFGDEIHLNKIYYEGAVLKQLVNKYERDPKARKACIDYYGTSCSVCDIDFGSFYGSIGKGFIHVHHLKPISGLGKEYQINPIRELRPVCPNCHAIIHRGEPAYSIEYVKKLIND